MRNMAGKSKRHKFVLSKCNCGLSDYITRDDKDITRRLKELMAVYSQISKSPRYPVYFVCHYTNPQSKPQQFLNFVKEYMYHVR